MRDDATTPVWSGNALTFSDSLSQDYSLEFFPYTKPVSARWFNASEMLNVPVCTVKIAGVEQVAGAFVYWNYFPNAPGLCYVIQLQLAVNPSYLVELPHRPSGYWYPFP